MGFSFLGNFNNFRKSHKNLAFILTATSVILLSPIIFLNMKKTGDVVGILGQLGIYNPPSWLVWAIIGAGSISLVVGALSTFGLATVPVWAAKALLAADSFSL
ncbi:MAG: hypothetical protein ACLTT7_02995 [Paraclostridium bifermentans]